MSDTTDLLASELTDSLKLNDADVTSMPWPQHADHAANAERLQAYLAEGRFGNMVVVAAPRNGGCPSEQLAHRGGERVRDLVRIVRDLPEAAGDPPRLYVVTRDAQTVIAGERPNLEQAGLRGLLRVIGAEYPSLHPTQIDVDEDTEGKLVAQQLLLGSEQDETAFRKGQWYTAQLFPAPLRPEERFTTVVDHAHDGMRLEIRSPGDLQTMELTAFERTAPGPGEIEVAVTASSLNFADVLVAMGRYPSYAGKPQLGIDFAGVVTAVGPNVRNHKVGDHVGGMSPNGCWGTFLTCDVDVAVKLPAGLRDDQAAAISTAAATAWYGLQDLARIKPGDKVLIHSATGGVGQAAIAIARLARAEIYATAGTRERREMLRRMGINNVYDSRTVDFAEQILEDTDGYGVDVVLNSLTGAAQRAGVELLAFGGRFIEIGKKDIYGDTRMGLFPFRRNLSFYGVDLALMCSTHPAQIRELLNTVYRLTADGVLPQPETTVPVGGGGHRHPCDGCRRAHRQADPDGPAGGSQHRGGSGRASSGVPLRRCIHRHRRFGRVGLVPCIQDVDGRCRSHRAELPISAEADGAGADREDAVGRYRGGGRQRRYRVRGDRRSTRRGSHLDRPSGPRCAARRCGGRGCDPAEHHR